MKVKMTQLRAWTLAAACGAALLATGCQTANGGKGDEAALPAATAAKTTTTAGKDCSKPVVAQSSHAVGDPCLTTADIAKSLGVSPVQLAKHKKKHHKKTAHH